MVVYWKILLNTELLPSLLHWLSALQCDVYEKKKRKERTKEERINKFTLILPKFIGLEILVISQFI